MPERASEKSTRQSGAPCLSGRAPAAVDSLETPISIARRAGPAARGRRTEPRTHLPQESHEAGGCRILAQSKFSVYYTP